MIELKIPTDLTQEQLDRQRVGDFIRTTWADGRRLTLIVYEVTPTGPLMKPVNFREQLTVWWLSLRKRIGPMKKTLILMLFLAGCTRGGCAQHEENAARHLGEGAVCRYVRDTTVRCVKGDTLYECINDRHGRVGCAVSFPLTRP
jgi:hypothetical protein